MVSPFVRTDKALRSSIFKFDGGNLILQRLLHNLLRTSSVGLRLSLCHTLGIEPSPPFLDVFFSSLKLRFSVSEIDIFIY